MRVVLFILGVFFSTQLFAQEILCVNTDPGDPNSAFIEWSVPMPPCGPFVNYEVWASTDPAAAFQLVGTVTNELQTSFSHLNAFTMADPWYYYIIYNYNCPGSPPIQSATATNAFSNEQPKITRLELTDTGVVIYWNESSFPQTDAYVISYLLPNGLALPFDTVFGIATDSLIDTVSNPLDPGLVYTLSLLDGCGNQSSFNTVGFTLVQFDGEPDQDGCDQLITLNWLPYNNPCPDEDVEYNVYVGVNDSLNLTLEATQTGNNFNFFNFIDGDSVYFMVEVVSVTGDIRANSQIIRAIAAIVQPPREFYIYNLTVGLNDQVEVYFFVDSLAELRNLTVNNGTLPNDITDRIERFESSVVPGLGNILRFDTVTNPEVTGYYYQVIANDSCNTDHSSTVGRTISLKTFLNDFFENRLEFNAFELDSTEVTTYRVYRDYGAGYQFVSSILPGLDNFEFVDDVSQYFNQEGQFCYYVEADHLFTFPDSTTALFTTRSNTSCLDQRPSVYIPNAIVPNGTNNEFKPYIVYGVDEGYSLQIYNRWGQKLFESNNIDVGWRGDYNGDIVPVGGYAYVINFNALDGTRVEKKGIVSVVR